MAPLPDIPMSGIPVEALLPDYWINRIVNRVQARDSQQVVYRMGQMGNRVCKTVRAGSVARTTIQLGGVGGDTHFKLGWCSWQDGRRAAQLPATQHFRDSALQAERGNVRRASAC